MLSTSTRNTERRGGRRNQALPLGNETQNRHVQPLIENGCSHICACVYLLQLHGSTFAASALFFATFAVFGTPPMAALGAGSVVQCRELPSS